MLVKLFLKEGDPRFEHVYGAMEENELIPQVYDFSRFNQEKRVVMEKCGRIDPEVLKIKIEELKEFKQNRTESKAREALKKLKEVSMSDRNVMPVLIEAAKCKITLEEAMGVFREVYGEPERMTTV